MIDPEELRDQAAYLNALDLETKKKVMERLARISGFSPVEAQKILEVLEKGHD